MKDDEFVVREDDKSGNSVTDNLEIFFIKHIHK